MPLESGQFIPELVDTNPLGVDPVNLGDNHLRLIKTCVQGSFPNFVGTTGVPKSVNLSEDQINELLFAALTNQPANITALWNFTVQPTINGDLVATEVFSDAGDDAVLAEVQRPANRALAGAGTVLQTDEGKAIRYTGAGNALDIPALLADTVLTVKNVGSGVLVLTEDATTLSWLQGGAVVTGNRNLDIGSVCELHYTGASAIEVWGNGLS